MGPMKFLSACRAQLIQTRFLDFGELRRQMTEKWNDLPRGVLDAMKALERMVASVNLLVISALATHPLLTLVDLEEFILRNCRDFEAVDSFEALKLGPLHTHPEWQRACPSIGAGAGLTGQDVIRYLAAQLGEQNHGAHLPADERPAFSPIEMLNLLAEQRGLASHAELGVHIRAESWLTFVVNRARQAAQRADKKAAALIKSEIAGRAKERAAAAMVAEEERMMAAALEESLAEALQGIEETLDAQTVLEAHPSDEEDFELKLREWRWAPASAGTSLIYRGLSQPERKTVHKLIERDTDLCKLFHESVGHGDDRALILRRGHLLQAPESASSSDPAAAAASSTTRPTNELQPEPREGMDVRPPCEPSEVLATLRSLLEEVAYFESPTARLAAAEQRLPAEFDLETFDELQLPESSFAAFCAKHSAELDPLLRVTGAGGGTMSAPALDLASKVLTRLPAVRDSVLEQVLLQHFGAGGFAELGWRSVAELRAWLQRRKPSAPAVLPCALVLAAGRSGLANAASAADASRGDAMAAIEALPPLADVARGTQWHSVYLPALGALAPFLLHEKLNVLEVSHGVFVKLEAGALPHFESALQAMQPERAVALAVGLCAKAGSIELAPIELMRDRVFATTRNVLVDVAAHLIVRCSVALQTVWPLRSALFAPVFLDGLERAVPEAWRQLVTVATVEGPLAEPNHAAVESPLIDVVRAPGCPQSARRCWPPLRISVALMRWLLSSTSTWHSKQPRRLRRRRGASRLHRPSRLLHRHPRHQRTLRWRLALLRVQLRPLHGLRRRIHPLERSARATHCARISDRASASVSRTPCLTRARAQHSRRCAAASSGRSTVWPRSCTLARRTSCSS